MRISLSLAGLFTLALLSVRTRAEAPSPYCICVTNERSGDVTVIHSASLKTIATIPVGKRPRGIHASPDGRTLYVALSGRPIEGPPKLDAKGDPIFNKGDNDEDDSKADHTADGIAVIDLATQQVVKKLPGGSDPEQFAVSPDGARLYVSNEDVASMSVVNIKSGNVEKIVKVAKEPEGVSVSPDGRTVYVTCETKGEVFAIDTTSHKVKACLEIGGRPRNVAFLPDGTRGFIPSESTGQITLFDASSNKAINTMQLPAGARPMGLLVSPDGRKLYTTTGRGGAVLVLDTATLEVTGKIVAGKRPWGIALSPDGQTLFTANGPSDDISMIDLEKGTEITRLKTGSSPWGVTIVPAPKP